MELKKIYLIVLCILFISCNGSIKKESSENIKFKEAINESYEEIKFIKKEKEGSKDIFVYEDIEISINYFPNKLIGFHKENKTDIYKYDYDLDLGEIELIRFTKGNESLYLVELDNYYSKTYNIYFFADGSVYYLGEIDTDLPKIESNPNLKISFKINKKDNKISLKQYLNKKEIYSEDYRLTKDLKLTKMNEVNISLLMEENLFSPEKVVDNLIFTKDKNDNLQINKEILDYISKNTTRENSTYLIALENYIVKYRYTYREVWGSENFSKILAYIFNTTYPLRKKYWADKFNEWYGGKPEELLGSGSYWQENNYYGLPRLEEYERDFRITYW